MKKLILIRPWNLRTVYQTIEARNEVENNSAYPESILNVALRYPVDENGFQQMENDVRGEQDKYTGERWKMRIAPMP
jgi:hypothetical protein